MLSHYLTTARSTYSVRRPAKPARLTFRLQTVMELCDMTKDWRFANNPQVTKGGVRSYAGTQLHYILPETGCVRWGE